MNVLVDYAPDVCKDYKETGFCGYGDSCIFLHDRGNYKHGWQIAQDHEAGLLDKKQLKNEFAVDEEGAQKRSKEEAVPFACFVCREDFKQPVKTKCGHYFCEACALKRCRLRCFCCQEPTGGVFTPAKGLLAKIAEQKKASAKDDDG